VLYFRLFQTIEVDRTKGGPIMPRGDKSAYTDKQKRQAEHIEEGYEDRGVPDEEAERRAWATVNAMTGGGKKSGSGRGKKVNKAPARKGGRKGGKAAAKSRKSSKSSGKKAAKKSSKKGSSKR
jgi:plasmid stabilization system protein ParE